ncbi:MAG: SIS domain-containing protein [Clostridia bacterium]|nr:SIS domain-containing protein [Clostridia bacterium]
MTIHDLIKSHPALAACQREIEAARDLIIHTYEHGGRLLLCGNGGSCADCDHITGELLKSFLAPRPLSETDCMALANALPEGESDPDLYLLAGLLQGGLPALSLPSQTALLSAFANDVDPALVYAQLVWAQGSIGDLLFCLSTSGNSKNVVLAAKAARAKGMFTLALTGEDDSELSRLCDVTIKAPARDTYRVQEYHLPIYHYLCAAAEERFFGAED